METCPECKQTIQEEALFCGHCGAKLPQKQGSSEAVQESHSGERSVTIPRWDELVQRLPCSACGALNMPGETFCQKCGVQLPPVASVPPPPPQRIQPGESGRPLRAMEPAGAGAAAAGTTGEQASSRKPTALGELVFEFEGRQAVLLLDKPGLIIGRADVAQDYYPDVDLSPYKGEEFGISRKHARISNEGNGIYIEDLNSTNFTQVNGARLQPWEPQFLKDGDEVRLGLLTLKYRVK